MTECPATTGRGRGDPPPEWEIPLGEVEPGTFARTPRNVDIAITGRCNLRCRTCYYADEMAALRDMDTATLLNLIDELGRLQVMRVLLTGGEPLTHPDLQRIVEAVVRNRMRFSLNTNGTLMDAGTARFLHATGRCDTVQVSVDGSCAAIHDRIRGRGAFDNTLRGIETLRRSGLPPSVRVTLNRINFRDLPAILDLLLGDLGLTQVSLNEAFPRGAAQCNIRELDMTAEERREAVRICLACAERFPGIGATAGPLYHGNQLTAIHREMAAKRPGTRGCLQACNIAGKGLAVLHDGAVVPCHQLPHMVLGQAGDTPLAQIWRDAPALQFLRTRRRIPLERFDDCRDCRYRTYCTGGCPAVAYAETGSMSRPGPRDCYRTLLGERPATAGGEAPEEEAKICGM